MDAYEQIARFYDLSHDRLTEDIPFLLAQAAETGGPLLEIGCGSGRLLAPLAREGYEITGIDQSPEMLARAEARLTRQPAEVRSRARLLREDVRTLSRSDMGQFGLILFGYNTFMHLDEAGAGASLKRLRPLLRPGGRLLIDVANPLMLSMVADDPDFVLEETLVDGGRGEKLHQYTAYESIPGEQAVDVTWVYEPAGNRSAGDERTAAKFRLRYYYLYPHQFDLLLGLTGFRLVAIYGGYDGAPFAEESERLIVVAGE